MTNKEKISILELVNSVLSGLDDYLGKSGNWEASEIIFTRLGNIVYDTQTKLEDLTGKKYVKRQDPDA